MVSACAGKIFKAHKYCKSAVFIALTWKIEIFHGNLMSEYLNQQFLKLFRVDVKTDKNGMLLFDYTDEAFL